jgi:large subunit ribosomal protein L17
MRHRNKVNSLGRKAAHRKAMLSNMATSLIMHKRISTTLAKAKELRKYVEPLITRSKSDTTHSRRTVFAHLQDKDAVQELFATVSVKVTNRPGGYTRILKVGNRLGDNAEMAIIELVDFNELNPGKLPGEVSKAGKKRRRGGKKKSAAVASPVEMVTEDTVEEIVKDIKETASDTKETLKDKVEKAVDSAKEKAADVIEDIKEVAEDVKEAAEDVVEDVKEVAEDVVEKVKDVVEDVVEEVKETVEEVVDKVKGEDDDTEASGDDADDKKKED